MGLLNSILSGKGTIQLKTVQKIIEDLVSLHGYTEIINETEQKNYDLSN